MEYAFSERDILPMELEKVGLARHSSKSSVKSFLDEKKKVKASNIFIIFKSMFSSR